MKAAAAVCLLLSSPAAAGFTSAARGTAAAQFLKLGAGARAAALGEAYTAVADEASALTWNPAALTRVARRSAAFTHAVLPASTSLDYGAWAQNLGRGRALGAGFQYHDAGDIPETDETGANVGVFSPYGLAIAAGGAFEFRGTGAPAALDGASAGLTAKLVRSRIVDTAQTAAVDLGLLSAPLLDGRLRLGFAAVNLGGELRYEAESGGLPAALRLGGAWRPGERWLVALDLGLPDDNAPYSALGAEYGFDAGAATRLAARAGLNSRTLGDADGFAGFSFGFGCSRGVWAADYALLPAGAVGTAHRVSLTFNW